MEKIFEEVQEVRKEGQGRLFPREDFRGGSGGKEGVTRKTFP